MKANLVKCATLWLIRARGGWEAIIPPGERCEVRRAGLAPKVRGRGWSVVLAIPKRRSVTPCLRPRRTVPSMV